jgi:uncharacterized cupredoxin-like copper-binding protein
MRKGILLVAAGLALVASGCGEDDETTAASGTTTTTTPADPPGDPETTLNVAMTEFKFTPANPELARGTLAITAENKGKTEHELVLLKTNADPSKLPKKGDGVSEKDSVGEIPEVAPGQDGSATFDLKPGKYVMVCNIPGHYDAGMYGTLTVR